MLSSLKYRDGQRVLHVLDRGLATSEHATFVKRLRVRSNEQGNKAASNHDRGE
jgi:hypothetical protein